MLNEIKARRGIPASVTVYDDEIKSYIEHAKFDMQLAGISDAFISDGTAPVLDTISYFIGREMAEDDAESARFDRLYQNSIFRLRLYSATLGGNDR